MKKLLAGAIFMADMYVLGRMLDVGMNAPAAMMLPLFGGVILTIPCMVWLVLE